MPESRNTRTQKTGPERRQRPGRTDTAHAAVDCTNACMSGWAPSTSTTSFRPRPSPRSISWPFRKPQQPHPDAFPPRKTPTIIRKELHPRPRRAGPCSACLPRSLVSIACVLVRWDSCLPCGPNQTGFQKNACAT